MDKEENILFEDIWEKHRNLIGDINVENPKKIILIAGVPGSGKSCLLKEIQKKLNGIYLRSDDVRDIIRSKSTDDILANDQNFKDMYFKYIFEKYIQYFKNQTVIFDRSLDRGPGVLLDIAEKYEYKKFIISINCSEDILKERISRREKRYKEVFLENLKQWIEDHEKFNESGIADIYLYSDIMNMKEMVEEVLKVII